MTRLSDAAPVSFVLTSDRTSARRFYADVLGLEIVGEDDFAVSFALGNGTVMRLTDVDGYRPGPHTILGWNVDDLLETVIGLRAHGVAFQIYEGFGQDENGIWTAPGGAAKVCWFTDPDGNVLSLQQFG